MNARYGLVQMNDTRLRGIGKPVDSALQSGITNRTKPLANPIAKLKAMLEIAGFGQHRQRPESFFLHQK